MEPPLAWWAQVLASLQAACRSVFSASPVRSPSDAPFCTRVCVPLSPSSLVDAWWGGPPSIAASMENKTPPIACLVLLPSSPRFPRIGKVGELDTPAKLVANPESLLMGLIRQTRAGTARRLVSIANGSTSSGSAGASPSRNHVVGPDRSAAIPERSKGESSHGIGARRTSSDEARVSAWDRLDKAVDIHDEAGGGVRDGAVVTSLDDGERVHALDREASSEGGGGKGRRGGQGSRDGGAADTE